MCGHVKVALDRFPADVQMTFNLADGPAFGPVQAVQFVDLIGGKHGAIPFMRQKRSLRQNSVVSKIAGLWLDGAKCFQNPDLRWSRGVVSKIVQLGA